MKQEQESQYASLDVGDIHSSTWIVMCCSPRLEAGLGCSNLDLSCPLTVTGNAHISLLYITDNIFLCFMH